MDVRITGFINGYLEQGAPLPSRVPRVSILLFLQRLIFQKTSFLTHHVVKGRTPSVPSSRILF